MMRWITTLAAVATLTGCVYTQEVVYRERYSPAPAYSQDYAGDYQNAPRYYSEDGYYYTPGQDGYGDYYGSTYGGSWNVNYGVSYFDYPYYYSLFWPINRWYYDPFAYPGYRYGVTFFPSNYLSLSFGFGGGHWHGSSWMAYSPYRYSWVDNYYDWRPWYQHSHYSHYYPTPRYGDAQVEASRLADMRRWDRPRSYRGDGYQANPRVSAGAPAPAYRGNRGADYGRAGMSQRQGLTNTPRQDVRRVNAGVPRVEPSTGAFGLPTRANGSSRIGNPRSASGRGEVVPRGDSTEVRRLSEQRGNRTRVGGSSTNLLERERADQRGYALPGRQSTPRTMPSRQALPQRQYETPAAPRSYERGSALPERGLGQMREAPRQYAPERESVNRYPTAPRTLTPAPVNRSYSTDNSRYQAPESRYQAPIRQSMPRSEPAYQRSEPTFQRSEPSFQRSEPSRESSRSYSPSSSSDDGDSSNNRSEVRRVRSGRER